MSLERERERDRESPDGKTRISLLYDFNHLRYQGSNESHQKSLLKIWTRKTEETKKAPQQQQLICLPKQKC